MIALRNQPNPSRIPAVPIQQETPYLECSYSWSLEKNVLAQLLAFAMWIEDKLFSCNAPKYIALHRPWMSYECCR